MLLCYDNSPLFATKHVPLSVRPLNPAVLIVQVGNSCICQYHLPLSVLSDPTQDSLGAEEVKWLSLEGSRCLDAPPMQGSRAQVPVTSLCDAVYNRVNARSLSGKVCMPLPLS